MSIPMGIEKYTVLYRSQKGAVKALAGDKRRQRQETSRPVAVSFTYPSSQIASFPERESGENVPQTANEVDTFSEIPEAAQNFRQ